MAKRDVSSQRGQSLIIIAVVMTILLIFAAFAVDLGYWYVQRRQMQNAADAAALVGARELALHQAADVSTLTNAELYADILDWARRNHAESIQPLYVREDETRWALPNNGDLAPLDYTQAAGVYVTAVRQFDSFFARIVGVNTFTASAGAEARYGGALTVVGAAPLAYEYQVDAFAVCNPEDPNYEPGADCNFELFQGKDKDSIARVGWLGLDCAFPSKCSPDTTSLVYWMQNGFPAGITVNHNYMGDPGMKPAVLKEAQVGDILVLPLFDRMFLYTSKDYITTTVRCASHIEGTGIPGTPYEPNETDSNGNVYDGWVYEGGKYIHEWDRESYCATECSKDYAHVWCAHTDDPVLTGSYYYHIITFAAFKITAVDQGGKVLDGDFLSYTTDGTWKRPTEWDKGVVIVKLTE